MSDATYKLVYRLTINSQSVIFCRSPTRNGESVVTSAPPHLMPRSTKPSGFFRSLNLYPPGSTRPKVKRPAVSTSLPWAAPSSDSMPIMILEGAMPTPSGFTSPRTSPSPPTSKCNVYIFVCDIVVHLDGCVEVEATYYGLPPGWIGCSVKVEWDALHVRILHPSERSRSAGIGANH